MSHPNATKARHYALGGKQAPRGRYTCWIALSSH
jgi:hypothetical protein